jgi:hypothetical protein
MSVAPTCRASKNGQTATHNCYVAAVQECLVQRGRCTTFWSRMADHRNKEVVIGLRFSHWRSGERRGERTTRSHLPTPCLEAQNWIRYLSHEQGRARHGMGALLTNVVVKASQSPDELSVALPIRQTRYHAYLSASCFCLLGSFVAW